ncbi:MULTISPECIES: hypothetical protein [unclassified Pseudomonas]|uniref:hypothetical protein n=1 Tax=unclassified Pseudomonas TaxID=196821 RepID=UPI001CBF4E55|nr:MULTISPECIES: hypothetical protein [unclassified Pseudomonas]
MTKPLVQPRILRFLQAPAYLGMCRDEFNKTVRPNVREFPIGKQGVGFDRLELDAWADAYIAANAIDKRTSNGSLAQRSGTDAPSSSRRPHHLTSQSVISQAKIKQEFEKALEMVLGKPKRKTQSKA